MIKIEVKTNWECYSQYGNEPIELVAVNSSKIQLEKFEGDCPPLFDDCLAYIVHNILVLHNESHITEYLLKFFPVGCNEVTISKKQIDMLLQYCLSLNGDTFAPCYADKYNDKLNAKAIVKLKWGLRAFDDEWYDGERHQWILKRIK